MQRSFSSQNQYITRPAIAIGCLACASGAAETHLAPCAELPVRQDRELLMEDRWKEKNLTLFLIAHLAPRPPGCCDHDLWDQAVWDSWERFRLPVANARSTAPPPPN